MEKQSNFSSKLKKAPKLLSKSEEPNESKQSTTSNATTTTCLSNKSLSVVRSVVNSYQTPIKLIKNLSKKSQQLVDRLIHKKKEALLKNDLADSAFSLEFRYGDLLSHQANLHLPSHLKLLVKQQGRIDELVNYFNSIEKPLTFEELATSVTKEFDKQFILDNFKQLLFAAPHFYTIANKSEKIIVNIPFNYLERLQLNYTYKRSDESEKSTFVQLTVSEIEARKNKLNEVLIQICLEQQEEVLRAKNIKYDAKRARVWHSEFDLDSVKIPLFDFNVELNKKWQLNAKELEEVLSEEEPESDNILENSYLSKQTMNRIRQTSKLKSAKKLFRTEIQEGMEEVTAQRSKVKIARTIEQLMRKDQAIEYEILLNKLTESGFKDESKKAVESLIEEGFFEKRREGKVLVRSKTKLLQEIK